MISPCRCNETPPTLAESMAVFQRQLIHACLLRHGWNVTGTARELGISRKHLTMLIDRHRLTRPAK